MLMPAGVLVVLVLAALAVDSAIAFLGERELTDMTAAAANDAATTALRADVFYECGRLEVDPSAAESIAGAVAAQRTSDAVMVTGVAVAVDNTEDPPAVTVTAEGTVRLLFTPALPWQRRTAPVGARSTAVPASLGRGSANATC